MSHSSSFTMPLVPIQRRRTDAHSYTRIWWMFAIRYYCRYINKARNLENPNNKKSDGPTILPGDLQLMADIKSRYEKEQNQARSSTEPVTCCNILAVPDELLMESQAWTTQITNPLRYAMVHLINELANEEGFPKPCQDITSYIYTYVMAVLKVVSPHPTLRKDIQQKLSTFLRLQAAYFRSYVAFTTIYY